MPPHWRGSAPRDDRFDFPANELRGLRHDKTGAGMALLGQNPDADQMRKGYSRLPLWQCMKSNLPIIQDHAPRPSRRGFFVCGFGAVGGCWRVRWWGAGGRRYAEGRM